MRERNKRTPILMIDNIQINVNFKINSNKKFRELRLNPVGFNFSISNKDCFVLFCVANTSTDTLFL